MDRREFLQAATVGVSSAALAAPVAAEAQTGGKFKMKYAPHQGMFRNHAPGGIVDELKFMADQGFMAFEDNGMKGRSKEEQETIAKTMSKLGMEMGIFVANGSTAFGNSGLAEGKNPSRKNSSMRFASRWKWQSASTPNSALSFRARFTRALNRRIRWRT